MRKVLVIVPFPMNEENRRQRMAQLQAVKLAPDIEFDFRPVRAGPTTYTSAHDLVLADLAIVDAGMHAQAEGYDAVCIDTMSDSGVSALRSMLSIPVIGPGRASVRSIDVVPDSINLLKGKEEQVFPLLLKAALRCVEEDGADVILLGSTTMHEAHAWLADACRCRSSIQAL